MADEFNPETATTEELHAKALEALEAGVSPVVETPEAVVAPPVVEPPTVFTRTIDLGDGSGTQVFTADSMDGLLDKLADAQTHATRKIRELSAAKPPVVEAPVVDDVTDDMKWVVGQETLSDPFAAFDKVFKQRTGMTPEEFKNSHNEVKAVAAEKAGEKAGTDFVAKHPEYVPTANNGDRISKYMEVYKLPGTVENLEKAYQDLSKSGLLETKTPETPADGTAVVVEAARIVPNPDDAAPTRKAASGLSARRNAPALVAQEPTEAELANMTTEQLRDLAMRSLAG